MVALVAVLYRVVVLIDDASYFSTPAPGRWVSEGACRESRSDDLAEWVSVFFPKPGRVPDEALRLCAGCSVRVTCAEYALEHNQHWGVWGGLTERQRFAVKRSRRLGETHPLDPVNFG
jgi:WhiB family redox-sensing transcriptional regulator